MAITLINNSVLNAANVGIPATKSLTEVTSLVKQREWGAQFGGLNEPSAIAAALAGVQGTGASYGAGAVTSTKVSNKTTVGNASLTGYAPTANNEEKPEIVDGDAPEEEGQNITVTGDRSDLVDNRLRISALRGKAEQIYGKNDKSQNIMAPLYNTGGFMFPYTPSIQISGDTEWQPHSLTHTNYDILSYQRTPSAQINLTGKFTVQNQREGDYALAAIHFLRTVGKMHFGQQESSSASDNTGRRQDRATAGLPPPVLRLRGYGLYMFADLRCVLKSWSMNYEEGMNLVTVRPTAGGDVVLPVLFTLNISIALQQTPRRVREDFNLEEFRTGALMNSSTNGGWF